jgi:predicted MPP superfamily phosphohydrolase
MTRTRRALVIETLLVVAVALMACGWSSIYRDNNWVTVRTTRIPIANLPPQFEGYSILLITDLHGKEFGRNQERIRRSLRGVSFDAVAMTGDYVDKARPDVTAIAELLAALPVGIPIGYVTGNADVWSPPDPTGRHVSLVDSILADRGKAVMDEPVNIERGGARLVLCATAYSNTQTTALEVVDSASVRIALSHEQPATLDVDRTGRDLEEAARSAADDPHVVGPFTPPGTVLVDFDLVFAGHTHAGQVRLPFVGAVWAPGLGYWPERSLVEGLHQAFGRAQFVGAGLGSTSAEGFFGGFEGQRTGIVGKLQTLLEWAASRRIHNPATLDVLVLESTRAGTD